MMDQSNKSSNSALPRMADEIFRAQQENSQSGLGAKASVALGLGALVSLAMVAAGIDRAEANTSANDSSRIVDFAADAISTGRSTAVKTASASAGDDEWCDPVARPRAKKKTHRRAKAVRHFKKYAAAKPRKASPVKLAQKKKRTQLAKVKHKRPVHLARAKPRVKRPQLASAAVRVRCPAPAAGDPNKFASKLPRGRVNPDQLFDDALAQNEFFGIEPGAGVPFAPSFVPLAQSLPGGTNRGTSRSIPSALAPIGGSGGGTRSTTAAATPTPAPTPTPSTTGTPTATPSTTPTPTATDTPAPGPTTTPTPGPTTTPTPGPTTTPTPGPTTTPTPGPTTTPTPGPTTTPTPGPTTTPTPGPTTTPTPGPTPFPSPTPTDTPTPGPTPTDTPTPGPTPTGTPTPGPTPTSVPEPGTLALLGLGLGLTAVMRRKRPQ
jgi:PEP-CTERM motif